MNDFVQYDVIKVIFKSYATVVEHMYFVHFYIMIQMNSFHVNFMDDRKNIENIILPFSVILFASNIFSNHYLSFDIMQFYLNK